MTTLYMLIGREESGTVHHRLGGGSSTAPTARVYGSRKKAEAGLRYCNRVYPSTPVTPEVIEVHIP